MIMNFEICWTCFSKWVNPYWECHCSYGLNQIIVSKQIYEAIKLLKSKWFYIKINKNLKKIIN